MAPESVRAGVWRRHQDGVYAGTLHDQRGDACRTVILTPKDRRIFGYGLRIRPSTAPTS
ncbi:hypothetical protein AB0B15_12260 [Streptomyces sp. NPDC045456]|uniref:hypothetical protein n=1 Tax=Streptomyces sp. NPDC045456 TaxID=3155254 RepID=UPI0033CD35AD